MLGYEMDYLPILGFYNAIRAEIGRLTTVFSGQQKSEFVGTVSHGLRSPLHGVLASIEFLRDTRCDDFQRSCIDTMDACAQTLLDTDETFVLVVDLSDLLTLRLSPSNFDGARLQKITYDEAWHFPSKSRE